MTIYPSVHSALGLSEWYCVNCGLSVTVYNKMTTYDYIVKQREKEVDTVKPPVSSGRRKRVPVSSSAVNIDLMGI